MPRWTAQDGQTRPLMPVSVRREEVCEADAEAVVDVAGVEGSVSLGFPHVDHRA